MKTLAKILSLLIVLFLLAGCGRETGKAQVSAPQPDTNAEAEKDIYGGETFITFSPLGGTHVNSVTVTLSAPEGYSINYSLGGANPTPTTGTPYLGPIIVASTDYLRAIAFDSKGSVGKLARVRYTIVEPPPPPIPDVAPPVFSVKGGSFTNAVTLELTSETPGAIINYTLDGTAPTQLVGTIYNEPIILDADVTVSAIAYKDGMRESLVFAESYEIDLPEPPPPPPPRVQMPVYSVAAGAYEEPFTVSITSGTPNAKIYYTIDGKVPSQTVGTLYTGPITVDKPLRIISVAFKEEFSQSYVTNALYRFCGMGYFEDPGLDAIVMRQTGGSRKPEDLQKITNIEAPNRNIKSLKGIGQLVNLDHLYLPGNDITDIAPLAANKSLAALHLSNSNNLKSIASLEGMEKLRHLTVSGCPIEDFTVLKSLGALTSLNISTVGQYFNRSQSCMPASLEYLYISGNQVASFEPYAVLPNLICLYAASCGNSYVEKLADSKSLRSIYLSNNGMISIDAFADMTQLESLYLKDNKIKAIRKPFGPNFKVLTISNNSMLVDVAGLSGTTNLRFLDIRESNNISNLNALGSLVNLENLYMSYFSVDQNLDFLNNLGSLSGLIMDGRNVKDLSPLAHLSNLRGLNINNLYGITDYSAISNLTNLQNLTMTNCGISDLSFIGSLTGLMSLNLYKNKIADISPLSNVTTLEWLNLSGNPVTDLTPLANLEYLDYLRLSENVTYDLSMLDFVTTIVQKN